MEAQSICGTVKDVMSVIKCEVVVMGSKKIHIIDEPLRTLIAEIIYVPRTRIRDMIVINSDPQMWGSYECDKYHGVSQRLQERFEQEGFEVNQI